MSKKDPRVDTYIGNAAEFARPILSHVRELVHRGCPEVEETLKWNMPAFTHKGILCIMAAFKQHVTLNFWKGRLVVAQTDEKDAMGQFGRLTSLKDLPPDKVLLGYIRKAAELNEQGVPASSSLRGKRGIKRELVVPGFFADALKQNPRARANFEKFSYSHKKEYVEWLASAKREATRERRLKDALAWIADGKPQNWKYMGC